MEFPHRSEIHLSSHSNDMAPCMLYVCCALQLYWSFGKWDEANNPYPDSKRVY